jgi:hypothetical protein
MRKRYLPEQRQDDTTTMIAFMDRTPLGLGEKGYINTTMHKRE